MDVKLDNLLNEKALLLNMTDEDYDLQNYKQFLVDNYSFISVILLGYGLTVDNLDRVLAISLILQSIIIYSIAVY